jgi:hypothetical protein
MNWDVPQPWQAAGVPPDEFMAMALEREATGATLVVQTLINGYADDDRYMWVADALVLTNWRTGEHLVTYTMDDDPDFESPQVVVVQTALADFE